jgi:hypothetical protein
MSVLNLTSITTILDFIINDTLPLEYTKKFIDLEDTFNNTMKTELINYYSKHNIYSSLRYKRTIESWMLDNIIHLELTNYYKTIYELELNESI